MQLTLQALFSPANEGNAIVVETNSHATVQTLVSAFCSQKGIDFSSKYTVLNEFRKPLPLYTTLQSAGVTSGQKLYIGYKDNSSSWKSKWPLYVAILALIIGFIGILTMSLVYGLSGGKIPFDYGVVMDAGSSKTNTLLYHWRGDKFKGTGCVKQIDSCEVKGGLAKEPEPSEKIDKILQCAAKVISPVSEKSRPETPLYFAATAGMRLLNLSDPEKADSILLELKKRLNDTGLSVKQVSIISGRVEGIAGWITANFLKDTLDAENDEPWRPVTHGALDLGGASTQISFAVQPQGNKSDPDIEKLTLYGNDHEVFSKSYLCFGRDEAARRFRALLVTNPAAQNVDDPCAPKEFSETMTAEALFGMPCTQSDKFPWFTQYKNNNYTFSGTGDYEGCAAKIVQLTDKKACEKAKFKACFQPIRKELEDQKFLAFANFFYTTKYIGLTKSTMAQFKNGTEYFCRKPFSEISDKKYGPQYCFNAVYIYQLLTSGYGFNDTTWKNLEFVGKIDGKELGWSLGYMINATNMVLSKKPSKRLIAPDVLIVCLLIFIIAVVATIIYILHTLCRKKEENASGSAQSLYQKP